MFRRRMIGVVALLLSCGGDEFEGEPLPSESGGVGGGFPIAISFRYPFGNGSREEFLAFGITQGFGVWNSRWDGRHFALDVNTPAGTKIYALADGIVRVSNGPTSTFSGYGDTCGAPGRLILMEYTLPDGSRFTCLIGHVQNGPYNEAAETGLIPEGGQVRKGNYIGRVADYWADTDSDGICDDENWDHSHNACRSGPFIPADLRTKHVRGYSGNGEDVDYDSNGVYRGGLWTNFDTFIQNHESESASLTGSITCSSAGGNLVLTVTGPFDADALVGGALSPISVLGIGSNVTGWTAGGSQPYSTPFLGAGLTSTLTVPAAVTRFNLWVGGPAGVRWFDLNEDDWVVSGAGCAIVSDGSGGHVIDRPASGGSPSPGAGSGSSTPTGSSTSSAEPGSITCTIAGGSVVLAVAGTWNGETLISGDLDPITLIGVGSTPTGWTPSSSSSFATPFVGDSVMHYLIIPGIVHRFNLWVLGPGGSRWLDLNDGDWQVAGAGCTIVPDGFGGHIIER